MIKKVNEIIENTPEYPVSLAQFEQPYIIYKKSKIKFSKFKHKERNRRIKLKIKELKGLYG